MIEPVPLRRDHTVRADIRQALESARSASVVSEPVLEAVLRRGATRKLIKQIAVSASALSAVIVSVALVRPRESPLRSQLAHRVGTTAPAHSRESTQPVEVSLEVSLRDDDSATQTSISTVALRYSSGASGRRSARNRTLHAGPLAPAPVSATRSPRVAAALSFDAYELTKVAEARRSLPRSPAGALRVLESLDRERPLGQLGDERAALKALALLRLAHDEPALRERAESSASEFLRKYGATPAAARVRSALAAERADRSTRGD